jgi:multiple sugar transport system permease protein
MNIKTAIFYILLAILMIFFLYPIYFAIGYLAFQSNISIFAKPPTFIYTPTLNNFIKVINSWAFTKYLTNSVVVSICAIALSMIIGLPATYALTRFDIPRKGFLVSTILSFRFLPITAVAVPFYLMYVNVGLYDTQLGLILAYVLLNMPFIVWLMRGYFMDVPVELEDSYQVDGLSKTQVFLRITLPLVYKGLLATILFCFIFTWNDFAMALLLTGTNARTLPVQSLQFVASLGLDWGALGAAAILIASPMIVFGLIIRRYLIRGLSLGAVR